MSNGVECVWGEAVHADAAGQGQFPSGSRWRVQRTFPQVHGLSQQEQQRQRTMQERIQGVFELSHAKGSHGQRKLEKFGL